MNELQETQEQIIRAALLCILQGGVKKTTMEDVADQAGVTRMTLYRYFKNKKKLVQAAFLHIVGIFEGVQQKILTDQQHDVEAYVDEIEQGLAELPQGDLPARLVELGRVYPAIFEEVHERRITAVTEIFNHLFTVAREQGILRPDLNQEIVKAYFMESVMNLIENPQLVSRSHSSAEIFATVKSIFLYGILKEPTS
jgi:AcrR family transcriptional regulator